MHDLTLLSIFRESEKYLNQYISQITEVFDQVPSGRCRAIWLEGDSEDRTFDMLKKAEIDLKALGYDVTLIKYNCGGPYWDSVDNEKRWQQLSSCWNTCLSYLEPSHYTICVESDLRFNPSIINELIPYLDNDHHVIYPMLMADRGPYYRGPEIFYDVWGFSVNNEKFNHLVPYYKDSHNSDLVELTSGGGMIISTYEHQQHGRFSPNECIMRYPENTKLFMHKKYAIYHKV